MRQSKRNKRHISIWTASAFVISSMIGTGVFTSLGFQLNDLQSIFPLLMLWVVGGFIALFGALAYSELAAALPRSGGEYHLLSQSIHPSLGFAGGLVSATVGFSAPAVLAAMALGKYLSAVFPVLNATIIATSSVIIFHLIHGNSIRIGTFIQDGTTVIKIALILLFIIMGLINTNPQDISIFPKVGDIKLLFSSGFAISLVWVSYAYTGWNSSVYIAGEIVDPKINIPKSLLLSTVFVMVLYVLLNYVFLYSTPKSLMINELEVGYIAGVNIFGEVGAKIVGLGIAILLISTVSSYIFIGPRIMQVMGEDHKYLHFLSKKNDEGIPVIAFCVQLIICMIFILSSSFEQVLLYTGISLIISTTMTVLGLFVLRIRKPELDRPYKVWGYPFTPAIFIILNTWILFYTFRIQPFESLIGFGIVIISIGIYYFGNTLKKETVK